MWRQRNGKLLDKLTSKLFITICYNKVFRFNSDGWINRGLVLFVTICDSHNMSHVVRKQDFCLCENKGTDQLHSNSDSTISLLPKSEISSFLPSS